MIINDQTISRTSLVIDYRQIKNDPFSRFSLLDNNTSCYTDSHMLLQYCCYRIVVPVMTHELINN